MTGIPLRIGDDYAVGISAEDMAERIDLRLGTSTTSRRIRFVGDEHGFGCDGRTRNTPPALRCRHEVLHHLSDVRRIEPASMECAVGTRRSEHLCNGLETTFGSRASRLDDEGSSTHPENHAVATAIERQRRVLDQFVCRCGSGREEAGTDPPQELVRCHVIGGDDHHTIAPPGVDPILGDRHGLCCRCARCIDLRVGPACADVLGKLGVGERQSPVQVPPIELVAGLLELGLQLANPSVEVLSEHGVAHARADLPELLEPVVLRPVLGESRGFVDGVGHSREGRSEDHTGRVPQGFWQHPSLRDLCSRRRGLVPHRERDASVGQRIDTRPDGENRSPLESLDPILGESEFGREVDGSTPACEFDDIGLRVDRLEATTTLLALDESGDVMVDDVLAGPQRDGIDELLAVEQTCDRRFVEDTLHTWQTDSRTGHDDRGLGARLRDRRMGACLRRLTLVHLVGRVEEVGEEVTELTVPVFGTGGRNGNRLPTGGQRPRSRCWGVRCPMRFVDMNRRGTGLYIRRTCAESSGVETAQRLIERDHVPLLRMVGEQGADVASVAEDIVHETLKGLLRSHFDEHPCARCVEPLETLDELDR